MLALLLSAVALGLWFITSKPGTERVVDQATPASEVKSTAEQQAAQAALREAKAERVRVEQEQQRSEELRLALQAEKDRAAEEAAEKARLDAEAQREAADALVKQEAEKAAADALQAEQLAKEKAEADALARQEEERVKAEALAARKREEERLARQAERQALARKERRLKQAIGSAQTSLSVGDLSSAQQQLENAQSISSSDARVQTLALAVQSAVDEYNRPVSDADFDTVTRMFDALRRAIENKDTVALDRLAETSQQSAIFKSLIKNFERINVSITGIRVRNADKSITGTLRIDSMIRANGDRGSLSDQYTSRPITSRRVYGGWSKIQW